jgi:hypothetical protein
MLREQVVRTCTSSTRPTGVEGAVIYETDTDKIYVYNGTAWCLTASLAAYETWTVVITQGATPSLAATTYAGYHRSGRKIQGACVQAISATTPGTAANNVVVNLPVTSHASWANMVVGEGWIFDSSTGFYHYGLLRMLSTTTAHFQIRTNGAAATALGSSSFTAALANNDVISYNFSYEAAAAS